MSKNYDLIATVDINIASPLNDEDSFGSLLLVGPLPESAPDTAPDLVGSYTSLGEVQAAGWVTSGPNADPIGAAAALAFSQAKPPEKIFIAPIQLVEVPAEEPEEGEEPAEPTYEPESPVAAISRALDYSGWYIVCTAGVNQSEYASVAAFVETTRKMFCYTEMLMPINGVVPSVAESYSRTFAIYGKEKSTQQDNMVPEGNLYANVAWASEILSYESGSETEAFKKLAGVVPSNLTSTEIAALNDHNVNYFINIGSKNITMCGKTISGEWIDVVRFCDWLQNDMQTRVVNLFITNPKITLDDEGITLIQNQMLASLKAGQEIGGIAEDEYDGEGNVYEGFTTSVPLAASLTDEQKASRRLNDFKFKARIAGAIHFAEITGSLTYSL